MASNNGPQDVYDNQNNASIPLGLPIVSRSLSNSDYLLVTLSLLCCSVALAVVFEPNIASMLGQVNQLIALGFLLQIMALCTQREIRYFLLLAECQWHKTTLQNLESITRMDMTGANITILNRLAILLTLIFPIGLGVAYKAFTGGLTISAFTTASGMYGVTGPPGTVGINTSGRVLFVNATLPWWTNPATYGPFGFNMHVESANRTAMLDGPTPDYVTTLRSKLREGQSMNLTTVVNATVCDLVINIANPNIKSDLNFWYSNKTANSTTPRQATDNFWGDSIAIYSNAASTIGFGLLVPWGDKNSNFMMTSRFNTSKDESFGSEAQGFALYRQRYRAVWAITKSSVSLRLAEKQGSGPLRDAESTAMLGDNWLNLARVYPAIVAEYDWKYLGNMGFHANPSDVPPTVQQRYITTDTTLVASMVWSRIATWNGLASTVYQAQLKEGLAWPGTLYPSSSTYQIETETLKRSPLLAVVLGMNTFLLLLVMTVRLTLLRGAPIWVNFGITSLLAAIDHKSIDLLRGASYSGELKEAVGVKFSVVSPDRAGNESGYERTGYDRGEHIVVTLDRMSTARSEGPVRRARITKGIVYE